MPVEPALQSTDHGVGITQFHRQCRNDCRAGAHQRPCTVGGDSMTPGPLKIGIDVTAVARIALGVDQFEIASRFQRQTKPFKTPFHNVGPANQNGLRQSFLQSHLCRSQDPLVFALGIDHPARR